MDIATLLISAAAAIFFAVRLYQVLGRKTGHTPEARQSRKPTTKPRSEGPADMSAGLAGGETRAPRTAGIMDPEQFLEGAQKAYNLIVLGFASGDKAALEPLLTPKVFASYAKAIDDRATREETTTTEIERIRETQLVDSIQTDEKQVFKVHFKAEIATETNSKAGTRISGDLSRITEVEEIWSFERRTDTSEPNWRLAGVKAV